MEMKPQLNRDGWMDDGWLRCSVPARSQVREHLISDEVDDRTLRQHRHGRQVFPIAGDEARLAPIGLASRGPARSREKKSSESHSRKIVIAFLNFLRI